MKGGRQAMTTTNERSGSPGVTTVTCTMNDPPVQAVIQVMPDGRVIVRCPHYTGGSDPCHRRGSYGPYAWGKEECVYEKR